jgi:alkylation response protein AidB-like acyl-CoA dehydrogenase
MDFTLNPEQDSFRKMLRDFVQREIEPVAREWEQSGHYPTEIVDQMKAIGLFGLLVPEEYGGAGADFVSFALTFEEIARGWMGVAGTLGSHSIACWLIARYGTEAQKTSLLPDLATGKRRSGIALTEAQAGSDLQGIGTTARRDGDHYVVNGSKMWITNARYADPLPTLVKTDPSTTPAHKGMSVLLIDATLPGFSVSRDIPKVGYKGTESCEVVFDNLKVPAECLLGEAEGCGMQQVLSALETGRINVAARALGVAQASYDKGIAYSKQREAFGRPISEFQAIQLKLADMATEIQAARLLTYWAASKLDRGERADLESSMAKLFASEVALKASLESMRIHGGYGYSSEFEVERYYRDAPLMAIGEGTNDILRTLIAKQLLAGAELR